MRNFLVGALFLSLPVITAAQPLPRPKLVVGIVVDQMRWDYLYRYYEQYGNSGFKRLMADGFNCQSAMIEYLPSYTAPGHASIYTGSVPAIHGIAGNDWVENATGEARYCTDDRGVQPVGGSIAAGRMSPANMLATTITDELRLATNKESRVFGIAIKDRGSILPAGHMANGAYWFDDSTGNFISSTYYGHTLPGWLKDFNKKGWADKLIKKDWKLLYRAARYTNSMADDTPYEGKFAGEAKPVFPHSVAGMQDKGYYGLRWIPGGNTITFKAAEACIAGEHLGTGNSTDFLCVSFSSTDYAGHQFGPNSLEMEDMFLRFDEELASFLSFLDGRIGEGNYTLFLTADHGAAHNSNLMKQEGIPAGNERFITADTLNKMLQEQLGKSGLVRAVMNYQVFFNEAGTGSDAPSVDLARKTVLAWLRQQESIAYAVEIQGEGLIAVPEPLRQMMINGYSRERSGSIQVILKPGWYGGAYTTGTTHGTWNPYDTHIPLLWYGWGIPKGETYRTVKVTDIAATLAALLHVQMPNGCVGAVITEIMK